MSRERTCFYSHIPRLQDIFDDIGWEKAWRPFYAYLLSQHLSFEEIRAVLHLINSFYYHGKDMDVQDEEESLGD